MDFFLFLGDGNFLLVDEWMNRCLSAILEFKNVVKFCRVFSNLKNALRHKMHKLFLVILAGGRGLNISEIHSEFFKEGFTLTLLKIEIL